MELLKVSLCSHTFQIGGHLSGHLVTISLPFQNYSGNQENLGKCEQVGIDFLSFVHFINLFCIQCISFIKPTPSDMVFYLQFFLELMKVPRVESKLRIFSFKIQFHSQVRRNYNSLHPMFISSPYLWPIEICNFLLEFVFLFSIYSGFILEK